MIRVAHYLVFFFFFFANEISMSWRTADEVSPASFLRTCRLPLKIQGCVRPPTALRPLQSVGKDGGGMRRVIYKQKKKTPPTHTSCFPRTNQRSLISARAPGYCWRVLKPASPLSFPCWHHQGGLPYSTGCPVFIPPGLVSLHIFIPNKVTTQQVHQLRFCLGAIFKEKTGHPFHIYTHLVRARTSHGYLKNRNELQKHEANHVDPGKVQRHLRALLSINGCPSLSMVLKPKI